MTTRIAIRLLCLVAYATVGATADQRLKVSVSPAVALAPAAVTVRTLVEPSDANRALSIVVSSAHYTRSSEIPLEGKQSQRVNVFELRDIPTGLYEVRATLVGATGPLATAMRLVKVEPAPGSSR